MYFIYGEKEIAYLKHKDKILGDAIDKIGTIKRETEPDLFRSVIHHIIGQQISVKAQRTIWKRFNLTFDKINADNIILSTVDKIQKLGLTFKKAEYIMDFALKVNANMLDLEKLYALSDADVIKSLSSLNGIGPWTAEMIMLFCMQRSDIMSFGDLAIHRGLKMLYHHEKIDKKTFHIYRQRFSPYGSVASLYLWAIAGGALDKIECSAEER